jgi:hypothetical protein
MESVIIDRFEGDYAVLMRSDSPLLVLRTQLPSDVREGDYLKVELQDDQLIQVEHDEQATAEARQRIQAKLDRLRRGDHLSGHDSE